MRFKRILNWFSIAVGLACVLGGSTRAAAQVPQSYGQYYQKNAAKYRGQFGTQSSTRYLYDKYFYNSPGVSPYMNLYRPGTMSDTAYQAYVRPEQQRRAAAERAQAAYLQQRKLEGNVGDTRYPGANFVGATVGDAYLKPVPAVKSPNSAYYNHWYGNWAK